MLTYDVLTRCSLHSRKLGVCAPETKKPKKKSMEKRMGGKG
jgi:hypothetical protein